MDDNNADTGDIGGTENSADSYMDRIRPEWMICETCGYPLERLDVDEESVPGVLVASEWLHAAVNADHEPRPVDASTVEHINQKCDFCGAPDVDDLILSTPFLFPGGTEGSTNNWAACGPCADLVMRNRWSALVTRVRESRHNSGAAKRLHRKYLLEIYQLLQMHILGRTTITEWRQRSAYPVPTDT